MLRGLGPARQSRPYPFPPSPVITYMSRLAVNEVDVGEVLSNYAGRLMRHAHRYLRDAEQARDVVQDTFLRLWQHDDLAALDGRLPQWLFTVCRNRALDLRRQRARVERIVGDAVFDAPSAEPSPARLLET